MFLQNKIVISKAAGGTFGRWQIFHGLEGDDGFTRPQTRRVVHSQYVQLFACQSYLQRLFYALKEDRCPPIWETEGPGGLQGQRRTV